MAIIECRFAGTVNIRIYLAVYGPEIIGGFGLDEKGQKTKAVCGLGRTNYVRPPIIDAHSHVVCKNAI